MVKDKVNFPEVADVGCSGSNPIEDANVKPTEKVQDKPSEHTETGHAENNKVEHSEQPRMSRESVSMPDIMDDVKTDSEGGKVAKSVQEGATEIKKEGGFLDSLKNIGGGLIKALCGLLVGTLNLTGSLLMGRGMGMGMGMMGGLSNPMGMLFGSFMGNNMYRNNMYGNNYFARETYGGYNDNSSLNNLIQNLMAKIDNLSQDNRNLRNRLDSMNDDMMYNRRMHSTPNRHTTDNDYIYERAVEMSGGKYNILDVLLPSYTNALFSGANSKVYKTLERANGNILDNTKGFNLDMRV